jgi:DNA-binding NtrC family response regulator
MGEKVLLVEDDAAIVTMLTAALRQWGYDVLHAGKSRTAVDFARAYGGQIGVALCDVVLPDCPSPSVSAAIRAHCPGVWLIYTSGYPPDFLAERGAPLEDVLKEGRAQFLPKPFRPADIRDAIVSALLSHVETRERKVYAAAAH